MLKVLLLALIGPALFAAEKSIDELWADYDPRSEPLEIEILREWNEGSSLLREFFFTGMTHEGENVRVYAIYGAPVGKKKLPATLHIHGGGGDAYLPWVKYWNERGYACLSFNWGGEWPDREKVTRWGKLRQGNHRFVGSLVQATEPSAKLSSWYLWTRISRRALTALESQPEVDSKKLGIFGISMGGTIVWPMSAMDPRVRAACAIYGAGWNTYPETTEMPDKPDQPTLDWRRLMEPESYAARVRCPILFLNASNDQHGKMDFCQKTIDLVRAPVRQAYSPLYRHHIAAEQGIDLPLWMDHWLKNSGPAWPKSPRLKFLLTENRTPQFEVRPDKPNTILRVEIFYALDNPNPKNRFWRTAAVEKSGNVWRAPAPILPNTTNLYGFANIYYQSGICISSDLQQARPVNATATDNASLLIDDFSNGLHSWASSSPGTDPLPPNRKIIQQTTGPNSLPGMTTTLSIPLFTHKIGDRKWHGPDGAALEMTVFSATNKTIHVVLHENEFAIGWKPYTNTIQVAANPGWQKFSFSTADFRGSDGPLTNWKKANMLELISPGNVGPQPTYGRFEWQISR